jgi:hypothetical protein
MLIDQICKFVSEGKNTRGRLDDIYELIGKEDDS